jgi:hypothetical protein
MTPFREQELIEAHRDLRKVAFEYVQGQVDAYFREAEGALASVKVASELVEFDRALLKHFSEE